MDKIVLFFALFLFSVEDFRKQSISVVWFWCLFILILLLLFFPTSRGISGSFPRLPIAMRNILSDVTGYMVLEEWIGNLIRQCFATHSFLEILYRSHWIRLLCITVLRGGIGFLFMYLPYVFSKKQGLGEGDIIFFALLSPMFPIASIWASFCITFLSGSIFAIVAIFVQKVKSLDALRIEKIPLIPFISLGFFVGFFL